MSKVHVHLLSRTQYSIIYYYDYVHKHSPSLPPSLYFSLPLCTSLVSPSGKEHTELQQAHRQSSHPFTFDSWGMSFLRRYLLFTPHWKQISFNNKPPLLIVFLFAAVALSPSVTETQCLNGIPCGIPISLNSSSYSNSYVVPSNNKRWRESPIACTMLKQQSPLGTNLQVLSQSQSMHVDYSE